MRISPHRHAFRPQAAEERGPVEPGPVARPPGQSGIDRGESRPAQSGHGVRAGGIGERHLVLGHFRADAFEEEGEPAFMDEPPVRQDGDPVGEAFGLGEIMGGDEDRGALLPQAREHRMNRGARVQVHSLGRLVEEDEARPRHQARGDIGPALVAAGQVAHRTPRHLAEIGQIDGGLDRRLALAPADPRELREDGKVLRHGEAWIEGDFLRKPSRWRAVPRAHGTDRHRRSARCRSPAAIVRPRCA